MTSRSMCTYVHTHKLHMYTHIYRTAKETSTVYTGVWGPRGSKQHTWHPRSNGNEESQKQPPPQRRAQPMTPTVQTIWLSLVQLTLPCPSHGNSTSKQTA